MPDPTGRISHLPNMHRGIAWKEPVRCATTGSITIATALNAGDSIDGISLVAGDRVLVKDQADPSQNGIYVAGATPVRAFDMDQDATTDVPASEVVGAFVYVAEGTLNRETVWRSTNTGAPTIGTTSLFFAQFGAIVGPGVLYFDDTASVGAYQTLTFTADTATGEEEDTGVVNAAGGEVLIEGYMTGAGVPGLTVLPSGQWAFHTFRKVDNITGITRLVFKVYTYAVDTTETLLFTVTSDEIDDTAVNSAAVIYATSQPDFVVASTDRILVKVYCTTTSVANRTVSFYHNGTTHYSHLVTPFASPGGGPGSLALDDLTDVTITAPSDGEVLTYDNGTSEWVNAAPTGGVDELAELTDVNLDYLDDGDFLVYNAASGLWITTGAPSGTVPDGTDPGDVLAWDGAAWDVLPIGTDDDVLTADSGETLGLKWAAAAGGGDFVLLEQHTASSSASLDFTTAITSTYDDYVIECIGIIPATNGAIPELVFSTDGGSTWDTTANRYSWNVINSGFGSGTTGSAGGHGTAANIQLFNAGLYSSATPAFASQIHLPGPLSASNYKYITAVSVAVYSATGLPYQVFSSGSYNLTTAVNAFRFIFDTGNIASGTIRCYGLAK